MAKGGLPDETVRKQFASYRDRITRELGCSAGSFSGARMKSWSWLTVLTKWFIVIPLTCVYAFFTVALFKRVLPGLDSDSSGYVILFTLGLNFFKFYVVLVPVCILAAALRWRPFILIIWYALLIYAGIVGDAVCNDHGRVFDPVQGTSVTWQFQIMDSFALLLLLGLPNAIPTVVTWFVGGVVFDRQKQRSGIG